MEKFTFNSIPKSLEELQALPEANLDSPYKTAALSLLVLCNYKNDVELTHTMLNYLREPEPLRPFEKQFLKDKLRGKEYKTFSFFEGANNALEFHNQQILGHNFQNAKNFLLEDKGEK